MADAPTTSPAPAAPPAAPKPDPAPAPAPSVDAAIQAALDRAAKADALSYRNEQAAKQASEKAAALEARLKAIDSDPFTWLTKDKGITADMALERFAQGRPGPSEEVLQLRQELADMRTWREQLTQAQAEERRQAQLGGIAHQARSLVQAAQDPDAIKGLAFADAIAGGQADFSSKIRAYQEQARQSGQDLTAEQAAGMLRAELAGMVKGMRENKAMAKALDDVLGRAPSDAPPPSPGGQPAQPGQTLTSDMAAGGAGGSVPDLNKMTEAEQNAYFRKKYGLG